MQNEHTHELQEHYGKTLEFLKSELSGLRTGRANTALIDSITVENYGVKSPLKQVASVSTADAKTITVQPWDKGLLSEIEKAIAQSDKGFSVLNDGNMLRLVLPEMSEDRRREIIKVLHEKIESARIALREVRDKIRDKIIEAEKTNDLTEDDKFRLFEKIDEITTEYNGKIKIVGENKEKEIMTI